MSSKPDPTSGISATPTDVRGRSREQSGNGDHGEDAGFSESYQSTDTVRRRPEQPSYGTVRSPTRSDRDSAPASQTHEPNLLTPTHSRTQVPEGVQSPKLSYTSRPRASARKPPMSRRASSNMGAPHRGEYFSVDDGLAEVAAALANRPSTIRRRTAAAPPLSRVQSSRDISDTEAEPLPRQTRIEEVDEDERRQETDGRQEPVTTQQDGGEEQVQDDDGEDDDETPVDEDDGDVSDAESFTLKDRQQAINETHPFGIRLWKPALYKKDRSVQKNAEGDIHSSPGGHVSNWLLFFNLLWTVLFGWWLSIIAASGALVCLIFYGTPSGKDYGRVLWGLAGYLFYPFGKFVRLDQQEPYIDEDQGEGRSISEYEQWQNGDLEYGRLFFGPETSIRSIIGRSRRSIDSEPSETESLLGRARRPRSDSSDDNPKMKRRLFGRGQWNVGRVVFFLFFYLLITPSLFIVSGICWFLIFWIPMAKVSLLLVDHLRRHPLALSFESDMTSARVSHAPHSSILMCTYRAVGLKYWKYTIDGTNIFLINLMVIVCFIIFDYFVLDKVLHVQAFITAPAFLFVGGLLSIVPLAYFIGQAVASISAQSSMGVGAAINAFFSTIVEVFLYCVALSQGKGALVEGSIIGSIFAGVLFLPGLSMCFGALKRKTQRFNARSAGVTSTMLLFAVIAAFGPTLFYQIYGTHELNCMECIDYGEPDRDTARDCRRCYFSQTPALNDRFYIEAVRPYCYMAAVMLFMSYVIGLWFTLRTHAAVIWNVEVEEKKHEEQQHAISMSQSVSRSMPPSAEATGVDIRDSHFYKKVLGQSLRQVGLQPRPNETLSRTVTNMSSNGAAPTPHMPPPKETPPRKPTMHIPGFSDAQDNDLVRQVAAIAATAATVAASQATQQRGPSTPGRPGSASGGARRATPAAGGAAAAGGGSVHRPPPLRAATFREHDEGGATNMPGQEQGGGHDAPNWSRRKSALILMGATVLYAAVAEILVDTVDVVLEGFAIDEKFLGITLFALVPNTTEFLNAISFAMNGNIALSMEIGSAYALQVCLLQIPALVLFSAIYPIQLPAGEPEWAMARYTFALLFPQWDMVTVILCVFLLSYMYGEGKSNYFKGSILLLSYLVVIVGFYFSGYGVELSQMGGGLSRFDTLEGGEGGRGGGAWRSYGESRGFKTVGRGSSGQAF